MIKYITIGRSWITDAFIEGTFPLKEMQLAGVYSRNKQDAIKYAQKFGENITAYDSLEEVGKSDADAVYVASPNSLHYTQSKQLLEFGKHVICEKPITVTSLELKELQALALKKNLIYMEAMMMMHQPQKKLIEDAISTIGKISSVRIDFAKTSSKYNEFLQGKDPNIFNPEFATGCLMDMGIYCVYAAVEFFGMPKDSYTHFFKLHNGADSALSSIYIYEDKLVTLTTAKTCKGTIGSEIQGESGTVIIDDISLLSGIRTVYNNGEVKELFDSIPKVRLMGNQAVDFCRYINNPNKTKEEYSHMSKVALEVNIMLEKMRHQGNLLFAQDKK